MFRSDISREKCRWISFKSVRRRRRSRRTEGCLGFWPPKSLAKAGQHRLPGGREVFRPGVLRPGRMDQSRFESHTTLQVTMFILGYELTGGKKSRRISPRTWNFSEKVPPRGARVGAGRFLAPPRGKFRFFASFSANCEKPPPPRIEPVTPPSFA